MSTAYGFDASAPLPQRKLRKATVARRSSCYVSIGVQSLDSRPVYRVRRVLEYLSALHTHTTRDDDGAPFRLWYRIALRNGRTLDKVQALFASVHVTTVYYGGWFKGKFAIGKAAVGGTGAGEPSKKPPMAVHARKADERQGHPLLLLQAIFGDVAGTLASAELDRIRLTLSPIARHNVPDDFPFSHSDYAWISKRWPAFPEVYQLIAERHYGQSEWFICVRWCLSFLRSHWSAEQYERWQATHKHYVDGAIFRTDGNPL